MRSLSTACRFVPAWLALAALGCVTLVPARAIGAAETDALDSLRHAGTSDPAATPRSLGLSQALRLLDQANPDLTAARLRVDAAKSRSRDASRWRNPTAGISVENFGGSIGPGHAESSLLLEQPVEIGGDRGARAGLARSLIRLSEAETDLLHRELVAATIDRFLEAWELQERVQRLRSAERTADAAVAAAEERLRAGAAPAFERVRAQGYRSLQAVERGRAEAALVIARRNLALQWGGESLDYDSLALEALGSPTFPPRDSLLARLEEQPSRRRAAAAVEVETWRLREARAARVPDLSVGAGLRHLDEADGTGVLVGISLPIPLWGNLRGAVAAGQAEKSAAEVVVRSTDLRLRTDHQAAYERYEAAVVAWRSLQSSVQPKAENALELIVAGYRSGRLGYLDIQDGQRSLLEADLMLIDAIADVWRARSSLELLLGASLEGLPLEEGKP